MAKITEEIPNQGIEIVLEQIGAILKVELDNQKAIQSLPDPINVFNSRMHSFNQDERLMFNISIDSSLNDNFGQSTRTGDTKYNIDIFTSSMANQLQHGGLVSSLKLNKYVGMVEYILSSPKYNNLDLDLELIGGRYVENIQFFDGDKDDTSFVKMARITLGVKIHKCTEMYKGITLVGTNADVKLDLTELGYKYEYNKD